MLGSLLQVAEVGVRVAEVEVRQRLAAPVARLGPSVERAGEIVERPSKLAERVVRLARVVERLRLPAAGLDALVVRARGEGGEHLLQIVEGRGFLAEVDVDVSGVVERVEFRHPVPDSPAQRERLRVGAQRLAILAQDEVALADVSQRLHLLMAVTDAGPRGQRLRILDEGRAQRRLIPLRAQRLRLRIGSRSGRGFVVLRRRVAHVDPQFVTSCIRILLQDSRRR